MRYALPLLAVLTLAGCYVAQPVATAPPDPAVAAAMAQRQARADSLLALPPDSLSAQHLAWLQLYYQDRDRADREATNAQRRESARATSNAIWTYLGISAVVAVLSFILLAEAADL